MLSTGHQYCPTRHQYRTHDRSSWCWQQGAGKGFIQQGVSAALQGVSTGHMPFGLACPATPCAQLGGPQRVHRTGKLSATRLGGLPAPRPPVPSSHRRAAAAAEGSGYRARAAVAPILQGKRRNKPHITAAQAPLARPLSSTRCTVHRALGGAQTHPLACSRRSLTTLWR